MDPLGVMMTGDLPMIFMTTTITTMEEALVNLDPLDQAGVVLLNGGVVDAEGVEDFVVDPHPALCAGVRGEISDLHQE
jgi:hypothetical protein